MLKRCGSPQALTLDAEAAKQLARWGRSLLSPEKIEELLASARLSVGVRVGQWQQRQIQEYAEQALAARQRSDQAGPTAVGSVGQGTCGPQGTRTGGRCTDSVCLVGKHG